MASLIPFRSRQRPFNFSFDVYDKRKPHKLAIKGSCELKDNKSVSFFEFSFPAKKVRAESIMKTLGSYMLKIIAKSTGLIILA
jgi:hypothetical protein